MAACRDGTAATSLTPAWPSSINALACGTPSLSQPRVEIRSTQGAAGGWVGFTWPSMPPFFTAPAGRSMQGGSDGPVVTCDELHSEAAHGGAAGKATKQTSPMKEISTKRSTNLRHSARLRSQSTPAATYGAKKNET